MLWWAGPVGAVQCDRDEDYLLATVATRRIYDMSILHSAAERKPELLFGVLMTQNKTGDW